MRASPSATAGWVATWRGLAGCFPEEMRLAVDPLGLRFAPAWGRAVAFVAGRAPRLAHRLFAHGPVFGLAGWLQLRTRAIDEETEAFVRGGGRQLVLLGAGFDVRASRLECLAEARVFEVDHPATQARKREVMESQGLPVSDVRYLAWDFEADPMGQLPARLASLGLDPLRPTLTIWEGVVMYLGDAAIESSLAAISAWSAPGSRLAMNYVDAGRSRAKTVLTVGAGLVGEPLRRGFEEGEVRLLLARHGWTTCSDRSDVALARTFFPPELAARFRPRGGWLSVGERLGHPEAS